MLDDVLTSAMLADARPAAAVEPPPLDGALTLLLACPLPGDAHPPLSEAELRRLRQWLAETGSPALTDLAAPQADEILCRWNEVQQNGDRVKIHMANERVRSLLNREAALARKVKEWSGAGVEIVVDGNCYYPQRLAAKLRERRPPVLFVLGNISLLNRGGVAVVGSRHTGADMLNIASELGKMCAAKGAPVVSGGAVGTDRAAMFAAVDAGGACVGVMHSELIQAAGYSMWKDRLRTGRLALVSPFPPDCRYSMRHPQMRNKHIYCMADIAVVVTCEANKGGTWSGATECLRHNWTPLYAVNHGAGNFALLAKYAEPLPYDINKWRLAGTLTDSGTGATIADLKIETVKESAP